MRVLPYMGVSAEKTLFIRNSPFGQFRQKSGHSGHFWIPESGKTAENSCFQLFPHLGRFHGEFWPAASMNSREFT